MERQNVSKNNINTTLTALTMQLQQLTQLVANLPPLPVPNTLPPLKGAKGTISLAQAKDAVLGPNCMLKSLWG